MVHVEKKGILLAPTENKFETNGVLNPAVFQHGNKVHIFYRAVEDGNYSSIGYAKADGPLNIVEKLNRPLIAIENNYENMGWKIPELLR
ncbi:hypothetical protein [Pedobacter sp. JCM 36344]|uniref:hypothetical protein n=1 Tax=Pedobacter sp. JCM 36344 TaxID=3374280 RepID=UPI00397A48B8